MPAPVETILVVDDEETVLRFSSRVLAKQGFAVVTASSGEDAIGKADGQRFDLLLTDVMMPGMNGCRLAESLIARRRSVRVLFMLGYAEDVLASNVGLVPSAAFLAKPFKPKALVTKVREVLGRSARSDHGSAGVRP